MSKVLKIGLLAGVLATTGVYANNLEGKKVDNQINNKISTELEKEAYSVGNNVGQKIEKIIAGKMKYGESVNIKLSEEIVRQGIVDTLNGNVKMTSVEINDSLEGLRNKAKENLKKINEKIKKESEEYIENYKNKEGVQITDTGLIYEILKDTKGKKPVLTDRVTVHYIGTLIDGTVFDNTYERKHPESFNLNQVIPGWSEGVQLMSIGSKYKLTIPSKLAYGTGHIGEIPPNSALTFEVELLSINENIKDLELPIIK